MKNKISKVSTLEELQAKYTTKYLKESFLKFNHHRKRLDAFQKNQYKDNYDLHYLVVSHVRDEFSKNICTYNIYELKFDESYRLPDVNFIICRVRNNLLCEHEFISGDLKQNEDGFYSVNIFRPKPKFATNIEEFEHDLSVGTFMIESCINLLNTLLQEISI